MAITNPQAVKWSNERLRPYADAMVSAYEAASKLLAEWAALGMAARFPDSASEGVSDGADADGRTPVTGQTVNRVVANATLVKAWFEAGTPARIDVFRAVAVNGRSPY